MKYLCVVVRQKPLAIHFSLHNPPDSGGPVFVPRVLGPYGLFFRATVTDAKGEVVAEPPSLRGTPKLDPKDSTSYSALEAGYTFGAVFEIDEAPTAKGMYRVAVEYSNGAYLGSGDAPVGTLSFQAELEFEIS